jgi:hypothetical protein
MRLRVIRSTRTISRWLLAIAIGFTAPITTWAQNGSGSSPTDGGGVPRPVVDLKPGAARYKWHLDAGGKSLVMDMIRTIKERNGAWLVTEIMTIPGLTMTDEAVIDKKTLILRKRVMHQSATVADLQFIGNRATGTITINGQTRPIDMDMGGVLFGDGPGGQDVIATLPLADSYTTSFRNFDVESQRVETAQLRVMGTDTVTVPAGTFATWKVLVTSSDGAYPYAGALWVDKTSRRVVKMATTVPEIGDAIGTAELVK